MERLRDACVQPVLRASTVTVACALAVAVAGCTPSKTSDTRLTIVLAPDASCTSATAVDLVDHLEVTLLSDAGATLDVWQFPFDVDGEEASLGEVPNDGRGKFSVRGTGPVCAIVAQSIFEGTSPSVPFDPKHDQRIVVPVSCPVLPPCVGPTPTPPPFTNFQAADLVLGQPDYVTCDGGGQPVSRRFQEPDGLELAGDMLWVADRGFSRIAAFTPTSTLSSGAQIAFVVGQGNLLATGTSNNSDSLNHPRGISVLSDRIVVMDGANHRGQITAPIPSANGAAASFAIGQDSANNDNTTNGGDPVGANTLDTPWGAAAAGGYLFVADSGSHRVLRIPLTALAAARPPADIVLGQANVTGNSANRGGTAAADTLSSPAHVASDGARLWVADTGNNRIVAYDLATIASGVPASLIVTNGGGVDLVAPRGVAASPERLVIADSGNHRVLVWEPPPLSPSDPPTAVLGQADFAGVTANAGGIAGTCPVMETCADPGREPTASALSRPGAVMLRGDDLWVSDTCNARVLRYRAASR